ncbi:MAG: NAD(P)/FAD-dependent oxidoreductase, partial [SAR202 cluster bacterium]|nr:NAD(P)/FAD-dependent oxidoreductase [SAR202 cluster bacterium]
FPRDHIGESLLPASMPVLEELGVMEAVSRAGFVKKWGATMVWGKQNTPWSWYFRETNKRHPHSYQVWRPQFDKMLLDNSRANGVDVREEHLVNEVLFEDGKAVGVRFTGNGTGEQVARARWIVDASGQTALLGRRFDLRQWDSWFQNLAVYAYYAGAEHLPPPDDGNILIEAYEHGWFWNIPLHNGWMSVGAVVDKQIGSEGVREHGPLGFLQRQIAEAPHSAKLLQNASLAHGPLLRDWSYVSNEVVGNGYVLVGDAACFIDPLFSSGVHLAMSAGVMAAAYVVTVLKDPAMKGPAAKVYKELYYREYGHFREMAKLFYASNRTMDSYFWEARRILGDQPGMTPREAFVRAVAGQPPRGYERVVLAQGHAPDEFVDAVRTVEAQQKERGNRLAASRVHPDITRNPLYSAVPTLAERVTVERTPVIAEGEFAWGHVLRTPGHPEGLPCSPLVAELVSRIDGKTPVSKLVTDLRAGIGDVQGAQLELSAIASLHVLYVDGTIAELRGI